MFRIACTDTNLVLEFDEVTHDPTAGVVESFVVRVAGAGLTATARVVDDGVADLTGFFAGLARDWRGWNGERVAATLDDGLRLTARADGRGHVALAVELVRTPWPGAWCVSAALTLETAQLDELASEAARSFGPAAEVTTGAVPAPRAPGHG